MLAEKSYNTLISWNIYRYWIFRLAPRPDAAGRFFNETL